MSLVETYITVDANQAWTKAQRRSARAVVGEAVDLANIGLLEFGLGSSFPTRTIRIRKVSHDYPTNGEASSALNLDIHIPSAYVRHNKVARVADTIPRVVFHEFIHCLRYERFNDDTLGEHAVSEGIAYVLEDRFLAQLPAPKSWEPLEVMLPHDANQLGLARSFKANLDEHGSIDIPIDELDENYAAAWKEDLIIEGFTAVEFMGIMAVREQFSQGATPAEIMVAEAGDILGALD